MLETGWTWAQLCDTPESEVWLIATVLGLDGEKSREQMRDAKREMHRRPLQGPL